MTWHLAVLGPNLCLLEHPLFPQSWLISLLVGLAFLSEGKVKEKKKAPAKLVLVGALINDLAVGLVTRLNKP